MKMSISTVDKEYQKKKKTIVGYMKENGKNMNQQELLVHKKKTITQEELWAHLNSLAVCQFQVSCQDALAESPFFSNQIKYHSKALLKELLKAPSEMVAELSNVNPEALWELVRRIETLSKLLFTLQPEHIDTMVTMTELMQENPNHAAFIRNYINKLPKSM
jgi:hypothetical protein